MKYHLHFYFSGKIAPIFFKKNDVPITIDSEGETLPEKAIDPEKLKAQRNFLLSGVPEKLKKSRAVVAALYSDYPPIPEVNHVQQFSGRITRKGECFSMYRIKIDAHTHIIRRS